MKIHSNFFQTQTSEMSEELNLQRNSDTTENSDFRQTQSTEPLKFQTSSCLQTKIRKFGPKSEAFQTRIRNF